MGMRDMGYRIWDADYGMEIMGWGSGVGMQDRNGDKDVGSGIQDAEGDVGWECRTGMGNGSNPLSLGAADPIHPKNPIPGPRIHPEPRPAALGPGKNREKLPNLRKSGMVLPDPPGPWFSFLAPGRDLLGFEEESAGKGQERELMAGVAPGWKNAGNLWPGQERGMGEGGSRGAPIPIPALNPMGTTTRSLLGKIPWKRRRILDPGWDRHP